MRRWLFYQYPISELASRSLIPWMFSVGGAIWALDLCETRLNHAIFLNRVARRPYFHFLYKYIGIIGYKQLRQHFWKLIWIYCYFLNEIGLDLELHNSNLVQKIPTDFATNNSNVWFFKHHTLSDLEIWLYFKLLNR